jgi:response regulator RpfG family c-di-GMP phosphodiesterase
MTMTEKVLCVDDDPNVPQAYRRALRNRFHIEEALGGEEALRAVVDRGPFAVVVADMRMPGMTGIQLLARMKDCAPDTVRMVLTGHADQQTALDAVNEGHIFRFLCKPCPPPEFAKALEAGIAQHRLITAERELLSKTLTGTIEVLTDVLALVNPPAFGRASRVHDLVKQLCRELKLEQTWPIEIAAMLSQVGCVAVPEAALKKAFRGDALSPVEALAVERHPQVGHRLLAGIPRLEEVAKIVAYQNKLYDGQGFPPDDVRALEIPLGSRILRVALDLDTLISTGRTTEMALAEIHHRHGWYDPTVVGAAERLPDVREVRDIKEVGVHELADGVVLADDVKSLGGTLLCAKGQEVTPSTRARLKSFAAGVGIQGPIKILVSSGISCCQEAANPENAKAQDGTSKTED